MPKTYQAVDKHNARRQWQLWWNCSYMINQYLGTDDQCCLTKEHYVCLQHIQKREQITCSSLTHPKRCLTDHLTTHNMIWVPAWSRKHISGAVAATHKDIIAVQSSSPHSFMQILEQQLMLHHKSGLTGCKLTDDQGCFCCWLALSEALQSL